MKKHIIDLFLVGVLVVPTFLFAQPVSPLPDPGTLPDSPFYFLKSWREGIQLFFTFNAEKKAEQYLHLAEVRLAEYEKMVEKALRPAQGESAEQTQAKYEQIAERTLEKYENQLARALAKAEELKEKGEEVADELKMKVEETAAKHLKVLEWNLEKVPEASKDAIERALEESKKQLEKLDEIFGREFDDVRWRDEGDDIEVLENASDRAKDSVKNIQELGGFINDEMLEKELDNLLEGLE